MHSEYTAAIELKYQQFVSEAVDVIAENLMQLTEGVSVQTVTNTIMGQLYMEYEKEFRSQIRKPIKEFVTEIYSNYREQKAPFMGKKIPDAVFNLNDFRTMNFYDRNDNLYLGKFITDPDTRTRINKFIQEKYFENSIPIGKDSPGINKFKDEFEGVLQGEDWKIRRVLDTTVNKLRNYGAVSYMQQVGVKNFVIRGISDKLQCAFCASMQGKLFSVEREYAKIETLVASDPSETPGISPFLTSSGMTPEEIKGMSGAALQDQGIGAPGYHPHCRDTIVIELE